MYSVRKMYIISVDKRSVIIEVFRKEQKKLAKKKKNHVKYFPPNLWNLEVISHKITF